MDDEFESIEVTQDGGILWSGTRTEFEPEAEILAYQYEIGFTKLVTAERPGAPDIVEDVMVLQFIGSCHDPDHDHHLRIFVPVAAARDFRTILERALAKYEEGWPEDEPS